MHKKLEGCDRVRLITGSWNCGCCGQIHKALEPELWFEISGKVICPECAEGVLDEVLEFSELVEYVTGKDKETIISILSSAPFNMRRCDAAILASKTEGWRKRRMNRSFCNCVEKENAISLVEEIKEARNALNSKIRKDGEAGLMTLLAREAEVNETYLYGCFGRVKKGQTFQVGTYTKLRNALAAIVKRYAEPVVEPVAPIVEEKDGRTIVITISGIEGFKEEEMKRFEGILSSISSLVSIIKK
jgi:hypothetical protein